MNKRLVGNKAEQIVCDYLTKKGLSILERNYRNRFGEIDIIAKDVDTYVFIEVKYRKTASSGYPEEAVNYKKINNICRVADYYRVCHHIGDDYGIRFDVVAIEGNKLRWHQNAFSYIG